MKLDFFEKLLFSNDTFFDATNLITNHIVGNRTDNHIEVVQLRV